MVAYGRLFLSFDDNRDWSDWISEVSSGAKLRIVMHTAKCFTNYLTDSSLFLFLRVGVLCFPFIYS